MWLLYLFAVFASAQAQDEPVPAEPRILNGWHAPSGVFLWQASLRSMDDNNRHFCGGSVIGKKWILTSAKCLTLQDPSRVQVVVGSNKLSSGGTTYKVSSVILHKNFTYRPLKNDIALIKLTKDIEFNAKVNPIELDEKFLEPNDECIVTGWGNDEPNRISVPDNLQMTKITVLSDKSCTTRFKRRKAVFREGFNMCSLDQNNSICEGDEGGPVTRGIKLVGVVSYSFGCNGGYPNVHTRVSAYIDWIRKHAKD